MPQEAMAAAKLMRRGSSMPRWWTAVEDDERGGVGAVFGEIEAGADGLDSFGAGGGFDGEGDVLRWRW